MRENLLKFVEEFNIIDRSMKMFNENFYDYKENDKEEFNINFYDFEQEYFKTYIKNVTFNLNNFPECNYQYISVNIEMLYKEKDIGYYMSCFDTKGDYIDDYFVIY